MSDWRGDVLGPGFECLELDLGADDEGPLAAVLVRALPEPRSAWSRLLGRRRPLEDVEVLYVHGWSDYFFQRELARFWTERGARFYALDLRKYGRSLRPGQTPGYIERLDDYDAEIGLALAEIRRAPGPRRRLVLLGHSTGGLVLSLWADRHRGVADALVLNSPWLELQLSASGRRTLAPVVNLQARYTPRELAVPQLDLGFYHRAQRLSASPDPSPVDLHWRPEHAQPVRAGWLKAILAGHSRIAAGIEVGLPVCVLLSARSRFGLSWNDEMLHADTVLDVESIARAALHLGSSVTVERIDGALHDVFLSAASPRAEAYRRLDRWIAGWTAVPGPDDATRAESPTGPSPGEALGDMP